MGKRSAHSLTVPSRVLHHMICSILLPSGGYRDEVSYLEAFIVDSILTGRRIHDTGVDLSRETDFEAPTNYDTYDEQSLGCMNDRPGDRDRCILRQRRRPRSERWRGIHVEATLSEPMMTESSCTTGPSSQPLFIDSLGTRMEELALVHDSRFYSMKEHMDQYQTRVISRFVHFQ
ncbi:hypothetical protein AAG906_032822 [Vitis piasezkii]